MTSCSRSSSSRWRRKTSSITRRSSSVRWLRSGMGGKEGRRDVAILSPPPAAAPPGLVVVSIAAGVMVVTAATPGPDLAVRPAEERNVCCCGWCKLVVVVVAVLAVTVSVPALEPCRSRLMTAQHQYTYLYPHVVLVIAAIGVGTWMTTTRMGIEDTTPLMLCA